MKELATHNSNIKIIRNLKNLGIGGAWKSGLSIATCDYIMTVAADDVMHENDFVIILKNLGKADLIFPYFANKKLRSVKRRFLSMCFRAVINIIFNQRIKNYQGLLPKRELLKEIQISTNSNAYSAEIAVKLLRIGYTYIQVPIYQTPKSEFKSVALEPRRILKVFKAIIKLTIDIYKL